MYDSNSLPDAGYVRLRAILRVIPIGKSTWWEGVPQWALSTTFQAIRSANYLLARGGHSCAD